MSEYKLYQGDCLEVMDKLIEEGVKVDAILSGETYIKGSNVYDMDNNLLYNCNQYFFFNRKLAKELQRIIDEDEFIDDSGNRIIFR